ncbi:unnamed protein product [Urochloa humidicola]
MRRLDLELQLLLAAADDAIDRRSNSIRAVAKAMMAAGYGRECVATFKSRRRAALSAALHRLLGFSPLPGGDHHHLNLHKLTWDQLDGGVIPSWLAAAPAAFTSLFPAEKRLCDAAFSASAAGSDAAAAAAASVGDAVFAAVASDHAAGLLAVAEAAAARARRAPERLFRVLDVHDALAAAMPTLLSAFGSGSEVAARAAAALAKVGDAARGTLGGLESAIRKEPNKAAAAGGGAVHPLTRYVMNYLVFLADYRDGLALLYDDSGSDSDEQAPSPSSSSTIIHRLVTALLGKLDAKAGSYREVALSYLFLANNTGYVASKVAGSGELRGVLGEGWAEEQGAKARAHVAVYVRAAWGKVMTSLSGEQPDPAAVEAAVMEAVGTQEQWVAADEEMGEALRKAAAAAVVPKYRMFYRRHGAAVRLTPGDVAAMIAALFGGPLQRRQEGPNPSGEHPTRRPRVQQQQQLFT